MASSHIYIYTVDHKPLTQWDAHFEYASKFLKLALSKPEIRRFQPGILNIPAKSGSTEAFHGQLRPN